MHKYHLHCHRALLFWLLYFLHMLKWDNLGAELRDWSKSSGLELCDCSPQIISALKRSACQGVEGV